MMDWIEAFCWQQL